MCVLKISSHSLFIIGVFFSFLHNQTTFFHDSFQIYVFKKHYLPIYKNGNSTNHLYSRVFGSPRLSLEPSMVKSAGSHKPHFCLYIL